MSEDSPTRIREIGPGMMEDMFRECKTHNKYLIMKLMMDGIPRAKPQIVRDFQINEPYVFRTTIETAVISLERDGILKLMKNGTYRSKYLAYPKGIFKLLALEILDELMQNERTPLKLGELVGVGQEELVETITPLMLEGYIELVESDTLPNNTSVYRLVK